mmetsp:Transcript_12379/g.37473  ORF Transcript_12379/g.37473 Transcript_12379/m.37473 type:complete len:430 (-) Transcript_12379:54-1343(-)|eukprot:CAMPEP_0174235186 /NCGR_PEP_ID=MMETSP0417-20130205/4715_1 /TAXON_ID=242541 /ORGANISM="Mayorella sp, Strain BSH-02190019" /LENGTH=429 /DNA_ID=CAMNT_0015313659 /DNA_START=117 /DNA_END=1406 /DNA_ORIENTATION=+
MRHSNETETEVFRYEPFEDAKHDLGCQELEMHASQNNSRLLKLFLKVNFSHPLGFAAKARQFTDHFVHVCVDTTADDFVCGVISTGVKDVWLHGEVVRVAYLFDLRVHEAYQRRGIGARLSKIAEELVVSAGATLMYLTVNGNNEKAKALYRKLGYEIASVRRPGVALLHPVPSTDPLVPFELIEDRERARALIASAFDRVDNTPLDLEPILSSPSYEGTLYTRLQDPNTGVISEAGLSLWNASRGSSLEFERVILPASLWRNPAVQLAFFFAWLCGVLYWLSLAFTLYSSGARLLLCGWILVTLGTTLWVFPMTVFLFQLIASNLTPADRSIPNESKLRGRLFAPWQRGPRGPEFLRNLVNHSMRIQRQSGYALNVVNVDAKTSLAPYLPKSRFTTFFMQRALSESDTSSSSSLQRFDPDAFHDPRDI